MCDKAELREYVRSNLNALTDSLNAALRGDEVDGTVDVLQRITRGTSLPHWYDELNRRGTLPNLDGKTIGSVVEMLFVAVLESFDFDGFRFPEQSINPARGVDLPGLDLGVKSPSTNYCTSEPFFSAYERLIGSEYDVVVFLTDYQEAKKNPPLRLQVTDANYLTRTQLADKNLCGLAANVRSWLCAQSEDRYVRLCRFLAYVNQSDWLARKLVALLQELKSPEESADDLQHAAFTTLVESAKQDFQEKNATAASDGTEQIPDEDLDSVTAILDVNPIHVGVIDACDSWVTQRLKDAARAPSERERQELLSGPLDGKIGMSFALQWRYNFRSLFVAEASTP